MLLEALRQRNVVVVVEGVDGGAQPGVVLLVDQQVVERLVDRFVVEVLHRPQVRLHQRNVVRLQQDESTLSSRRSDRSHPIHTTRPLEPKSVTCNAYLDEVGHSPRVIHAWSEDQEKVIQQQRLVVQVELDGLVVDLNVGDLQVHVSNVIDCSRPTARLKDQKVLAMTGVCDSVGAPW